MIIELSENHLHLVDLITDSIPDQTQLIDVIIASSYFLASTTKQAYNNIDLEKGTQTILDAVFNVIRTAEHLPQIKFCPDCIVAQYPPCTKKIPCCMCDEDNCNSRQPCPKKGDDQ